MARLVLLLLLMSIPFSFAHTYLTGLLLYPISQITWSPLRNRQFAGYYFLGSWQVYCATAGLLLALRFYNRSLTSQLSALRFRLELQKELAHANRLSTMGELTASISHEIRQPLTTVLSRSEAAKHWLEQGKLGEVKENLDAIINATARAADIITGLRVLAKKEEPRLDAFDMNQAVRDVVLLAAGEAKANNVEVVTELSRGLSQIRGDRIQLQQLILNLVLNGIQAMTATDGRRELQIKTAAAEGGSVSVTVRDTGPGMNSEQAARAFDAFYTTKTDGLGMGLAICRSIVESHDGVIAINSKESEGLTVEFVLPARSASLAA